MDFILAAGGAALLGCYLCDLGGSRSHRAERARRLAQKRRAAQLAAAPRLRVVRTGGGAA